MINVEEATHHKEDVRLKEDMIEKTIEGMTTEEEQMTEKEEAVIAKDLIHHTQVLPHHLTHVHLIRLLHREETVQSPAHPLLCLHVVLSD